MMRFKLGAPPESPDFQPEAEGWTLLRQPNPFVLQVVAVPVAALVAGVLGAAWYFLTPLAATPVTFAPRQILVPALVGLVGLLLVVAVHELLHGAGHPGWGFSPATVLGFWPTRLLFYAAYRDVISRNRYLWVGALPFVVLSVAPLLAAALLPVNPIPLFLVSMVNGLCACGDCIIFALIFRQVPRDALIREQGWAVWWKKAR
jgi:Putative zincin peptidase